MSSQVQIAARAGVSQSVVSRVLSGKAKQFGIADRTVARVRRLARELEYRPNPVAHMLLSKRTRLIGVVVPSFQDPFLSLVLESLREAIHAEGLSILVTDLSRRTSRREDLLQLESYQPDGYFAVGSFDFEGWPSGMFRKPLVQLGEPVRRKDVVCCSIDSARGAELLFGHLLERGFDRIALAADAHGPNRERVRTFRRIGRTDFPQLRISQIWHSNRAGFAAGEELAGRKAGREVKAVVAMDDTIALGLLRTLLARGRSVPRDVALAGFDGIPASGLSWPGLTTVEQPVSAMVKYAVDVILGRQPGRSRLFPPGLVIRESTGPSEAQAQAIRHPASTKRVSR